MRFDKLLTGFFVILVIITINTMSAYASSEDSVKIGIMTFNVDSLVEYDYLGNSISSIVKKQLEERGNPNIIVQDFEGVKALSENNQNLGVVQKILKKYNLDFLIWGKVETTDGNTFILDINLLSKTENETIAKKVLEDIPNVEMLLNAVDTIVKDLTFEIFVNNIVSEVNITGNFRIKDNILLEIIETKPGNNFERSTIANDIRNIYQMGFFNNVTVERKTSPKGVILFFRVEENPTINEVFFIGNHKFNDRKILNIISFSKGSFLEISDINDCIDQLESVYRDSNYHNVKINYKVVRLEENKVNLEFNFTEGNKIFINKISFCGNITFNEENLKKLIKSSEKSSFSWITDSGKFNSNTLVSDESLLFNFYRANGFVNVKIGKTIVNIEDDYLTITFLIEEGNRFRSGKCNLVGDLVRTEENMLELIEVSEQEWFNIELVKQDIIKLTKLYLNEGFANAEITPMITMSDPDSMEVTYSFKKNNMVSIRNIDISGNTVTRDAVIRRELRIDEYGVYNKDKIERSLHNIRKLQYFESVTLEHMKCQDNDHIDLNFKVKEKPTGRVTFGAGYSNTDKFFVNGSISQDNLMGRGQSIRLSGTFGSDIDRYNLSLEEPWLFGIPISGIIRLYKEEDEKSDQHKLDKRKQIDTGLYLGLGHPLSDFVRLSLGYKYNVSEKKVRRDDLWSPLSKYVISSISTHLSYDSRDGSFYASKGSRHILSGTYAGLGGDLSFVKLESSFLFYTPTIKKITLSLRSRYGCIKEINAARYKSLRDIDRFYLGGMDTIRAYDYKTIGINSGETKQGVGNTSLVTGGNQYVLFNLELLYPIHEELNLLGVVFYDAGEVFNDNLIGLKEGIGCGLRWFSPIGPIRIEAAYKLKSTDKEINWNISIGAPF